MTQKSKEIFADGNKLREKLGIYLQTPEKVEIYAQSAEAMFENADKNGISFVATWSWWGFFLNVLFCIYRKMYGVALLVFICNLIPFLGNIIAGLSVKYFIIKDFESKLDLDNDEALQTGTNMSICIIIFVVLLALTTIGNLAGGAR